jgi:hypothetical protein
MCFHCMETRRRRSPSGAHEATMQDNKQRKLHHQEVPVPSLQPKTESLSLPYRTREVT